MGGNGGEVFANLGRVQYTIHDRNHKYKDLKCCFSVF